MIATEGKTIAVIGATGRQGGQVARQLLGQGWQVRAVTRTPQSKKAEALKASGAEVVKADLNDRASLESAFAGAYGLYHMQPGLGDMAVEIPQGRNAAEAAKQAGIRHLVYGSAGPGQTKTGIQQWDAKIEVKQIINELGLPLTVLRPMAFMELMTDPAYYPQSSTWSTMTKLAGTERRIPWLSVQDLGAIAAKAFSNPDDFIGKDLPLAADAQSLGELREIYKDVRGKYPPRFPMPLFLMKKFVGQDILNMWNWLRANPVDLETGPTYHVHPQAMNVRTWLRSQAA